MEVSKIKYMVSKNSKKKKNIKETKKKHLIGQVMELQKWIKGIDKVSEMSKQLLVLFCLFHEEKGERWHSSRDIK